MNSKRKNNPLVWFLKNTNPSKILISGYALIILTGYALLCIPFFQKTSIKTLDNLFVAASALSTTGLSTISISDSYNIAGQLIILILIQIGGLGYMSIASFIQLARKKRISDISVRILNSNFILPPGFSLLHFIKEIVYFSLIIEGAGAILLFFIFLSGHSPHPLWESVFHSISAFCTAGFCLFNNSFENYSNNFYLNIVIALLSVSGAMGFIVFSDLYESITGRKDQITFTTRIITRFTTFSLIFGTIVFFISVEDLKELSGDERLLVSFFQSMTSITTVGFNTYSVTKIPHAPLFLLTIFMIIGASPSGTGGGIKSTTITALYAEMKSIISGKSGPILLHNKIPEHRIRLAVGNFIFYITVLITGIYLLLLTENDKNNYDVIFEATSALGTVGLSRGITSGLTILGKVIIIMLMFLGRIGPLSFGMTFMVSKNGNNHNQGNTKEDMVI